MSDTLVMSDSGGDGGVANFVTLEGGWAISTELSSIQQASAQRPSTPTFAFPLQLGDAVATSTNAEENRDQELLSTAVSATEGMFRQFKKNIDVVIMGNHEFETVCSSPYPCHIGSAGTLSVCEFCLKALSSKSGLYGHVRSCIPRHPPGPEIYKKDRITVFEIDGKRHKRYVENLCLLAKLFMENKVMVHPAYFLFYVLMISDEKGFHMVGYFSKAKYCPRDYNLSTILILPPFRRQGYGKLLVELSYELTKLERKLGSPEKPLSELGVLMYQKHWELAILHVIMSDERTMLPISQLCRRTGMQEADVQSTIDRLEVIRRLDNGCILFEDDVVDKYDYRRRISGLRIDPTFLNWTPTRWPEGGGLV